jgi:xanthine/CO dehydrogenase XdhC/CoxF family maturation factor
MRPVVVVVVGDEVAEHRQQMLLVEDDHVVQTLSAECPDNAFGDRVRTR